MKLIKKSIERDGSGEVILLPQEEEDMWHAYNLILVGDCIRATTIRKVQKESNTGSVDTQRVRTTLCIAVLQVEFDTEACTLRIKGRNTEENPYVKLGAHHTIEMELNRNFTLIKRQWDTVSLDRIKDACNPQAGADVCAVLLDHGTAILALITANMTLVRSRIEVNIPKKARGATTQRDKAFTKFFDQIVEAIVRHVNFEIVKAVVVASPGFLREQLLAHLWAHATRTDNKVLQAHKGRFLSVSCPSAHLHDLKAVLSDPQVAAQMADTKANGEVAALNEFYKMLTDNPERAYYGLAHVERALDANAIHTLLVTDMLFRSKKVEERKRYVRLVDDVRENGGEVKVFSSLHVSGQQLAQLSGVAAILRFPMPEADMDEEKEEEAGAAAAATGVKCSNGAEFSSTESEHESSAGEEAEDEWSL